MIKSEECWFQVFLLKFVWPFYLGMFCFLVWVSNGFVAKTFIIIIVVFWLLLMCVCARILTSKMNDDLMRNTFAKLWKNGGVKVWLGLTSVWSNPDLIFVCTHVEASGLAFGPHLLCVLIFMCVSSNFWCYY